MIQELEFAERSQRHIYGLRNDLERFARAYPRLDKTNIQQISTYVGGMKVSSRRRDNILAAIIQLSRFARSRNYLPEDRRSAAEKVKRARTPLNEVVIWTLPEVRLILDHVSEKWRPFFFLGFFAGLRSSEIMRLDYGAFGWDYAQPFIAVTRKIARKTRTDRVVPISENLAAWLAPYRDRVGPLYPGGDSKSNENLLGRERKRLRRILGLPRKDNALRHSFGTYRLAVTKDYALVAYELGNSPRKVREHYNHPRPEADGIAFFSIRPSGLDNVIPLHLPLEFV